MFQWRGVGWGGVITFMFLCTHRHSNLIIFLAVLQTQALLFHDQLPVGWGGVGWDNNVHVPSPNIKKQQHQHAAPLRNGYNDDADDDDDDDDDDDAADDDDDDAEEKDYAYDKKEET